MQTGYILLIFIFPISLEACCVENHREKRTVCTIKMRPKYDCTNRRTHELSLHVGLQQNTTYRYYRAVEGEMFLMPCLTEMEMKCVKTIEGGEGDEVSFPDCGKEIQAEVKHSGVYTCSTRSHMSDSSALLSSGSILFVHLQVVEKNSLGCFSPEQSSEVLLVGKGGNISCPALNCSNNVDVIWYKHNKTVSKQRRASREENGLLHLRQVHEEDTGLYFCDRQITEQGDQWTLRMAVSVTVVPQYSASSSPWILYPEANTTVEVEIGRSHNLTCEVSFPFEITFSPVVQWYMHYSGNMENLTLLHMERQQQERVEFRKFKVTQSAIIKEITPQHLNSTYTCIANNAVGKSNVTINLNEKTKVKWPSLVGYPLVSLLLVAVLAIVLHVKWLEVQLIYRLHFQCRKQDGDEKDFDVFLSYLGSPRTAEEDAGLMPSCHSRGGTAEEACLPSVELINSGEGKDTPRPLEVLLTQVMEGWWGYRLCLLDRDVLPGGVYTNDVILAIQRSQMCICVLSADYLSDRNAVFVLESGVQALLQNSTHKILLIRTNRAAGSLIQPEFPLPTLVQRALKVLPSLDWTTGRSERTSSNFWSSLMKAMPAHRVKTFSKVQ